MKTSAVIMAHPARRKFVDYLFLCLDRPIDVVWDRMNDRWDTGRRALMTYDPSADFHIVIQDDAIPCRDFLAGAELACEAAGPDRPVCFYVGRVRPHRETVTKAVREGLKRGDRWLANPGPLWGVAVAIPTPHIEELVAHGDDCKTTKNYDRRMERWYSQRNVDCLYTLPSLVDHRPVDENPSLVRGRIGNRRAHSFLGVDRSALDLDWSAPADTNTTVVVA